MNARSSKPSPENTLLRILQNPSALLDSIHEEYQVDDFNVDVITRIHFNKSEFKDDDWFYLLVQNPEKGEIDSFKILTPGVTPVPYERRLEVTRRCIVNRFSNLIESIRFQEHVSTERKAEVIQALLDAEKDLIKIPSLDPCKALQTFRMHFDYNTSQLKMLPRENEANFKNEASQGLYRFCKLLTRKRISLIRVPGGENLPDYVELRSKKDFDVTRKWAGQPKNSPALGVIASQKANLKFSFFAAFPPELRIHLPWAKRTSHYTLSIHTPDGRFFSSELTRLMTRERSGKLRTLRSNDKDISFGWTIGRNSMVRNHADVFIGKAASWEQPLYLQAAHYEIPGRSTLRMTALSAFTVAMMIVMTANIDKTHIVGYASAMIAIVTLGLMVPSIGEEEGFSNSPLLARMTPAMIFLSLCLYMTWGLTGSSEAMWSNWGFLLPVLPISLLFIVHLRRTFVTGIDFSKEVKIEHGGVFYS